VDEEVAVMKRFRMTLRSRAFGAALALAVLAVFPLAASADTFRFSGNVAVADFSSFDADGNYNQTYVFAGQISSRAHQPPGPPQRSGPGVAAELHAFRYMVGDPADPDDDVIMFLHAVSPNPQFEAAGRLASASLRGTFDVWYCEVVDVGTWEPSSLVDCPTELTVDLDWEATGALERWHGNFHYRTDGFMVHSRHQSTYRRAEAVGTITDGTTDYTWGSASDWAALFNTRQGEVIIGDFPWHVPPEDRE
jgi:hypothetical protein